jgi:uncharacterized protein DUF1569
MKTMARAEEVEELRRRIRQVRPDSVRRWGRMNVHQMLCHVADSFRMASGERGSPWAWRPAPLRNVLKWSALYWNIPWPRGFPTLAKVDQFRGGTRPTEFFADRQQVETEMERFLAAPLDRPHPIFGFMSRADWLRWGWLHTDHHLHQFSS